MTDRCRVAITDLKGMEANLAVNTDAVIEVAPLLRAERNLQGVGKAGDESTLSRVKR